VTIVADYEGAYGQSFVLSLKNRKWMKGANFAALLNRMGYTCAKYGGVMVKKIEHGSELSTGPRIANMALRFGLSDMGLSCGYRKMARIPCLIRPLWVSLMRSNLLRQRSHKPSEVRWNRSCESGAEQHA
jgi:hypothetical protein